MSALHVLLLAVLAATDQRAPSDARAGAWDRSVASETAGDLVEAERIMVRAWGAHPANYWAALRLAYLALLQGRYGEAARRYRGLRARPEAEHDVDMERGYASALGGLTTETALLRPELWGIATGHSLGLYRSNGWGLYAQLPVRLSESVVLRAAGRFLAMETSSRSRWTFGPSREAWSLDEEYLSLAWSRTSTGVELVAARSGITGQATIWGGGARLRLGSSWGTVLETAFLRAGAAVQNTQLVPSVFAWPFKSLALQAGARITLDDRGNTMSGTAGATAIAGTMTMTVQGHVGRERWAFGFDGPSIMSFDSQTTYGGSATLGWLASDTVRLFVQGDGARLSDQGAYGSYWSASIGVQVAIRP